jgi:hypothetical protein
MAILALCLSGVSATLSTQGYHMAFPEIFGAPAIGATISAMALISAFCLGIAQRQGSIKGVVIAALLIPVTGVGDMAGNGFALAGSVAEKQAQYEADMAAYRQAEADISTARDRLASAQGELDLIATGENKKLQRYLAGLGLYDGAIDGIIGPNTRKAISDRALELRGVVKTETVNEETAQAIISVGLPAKSADSEGVKALGISVALTLIALLASYLGSVIMTGGKGLKEELDELENDLTEFETEIVDFLDYVHTAKAKTA